MLALTVAYASLGVTPIARGALYGLGPVVLGLFGVAVYRLGRAAASTVPEAVIAVMAGLTKMSGSLQGLTKRAGRRSVVQRHANELEAQRRVRDAMNAGENLRKGEASWPWSATRSRIGFALVTLRRGK